MKKQLISLFALALFSFSTFAASPYDGIWAVDGQETGFMMIYTNEAGNTVMVSLDQRSHSVGPFSGFWSDTFLGSISRGIASFQNLTTGASMTGSFTSVTTGELVMVEGSQQIRITMTKAF